MARQGRYTNGLAANNHRIRSMSILTPNNDVWMEQICRVRHYAYCLSTCRCCCWPRPTAASGEHLFLTSINERLQIFPFPLFWLNFNGIFVPDMILMQGSLVSVVRSSSVTNSLYEQDGLASSSFLELKNALMWPNWGHCTKCWKMEPKTDRKPFIHMNKHCEQLSLSPHSPHYLNFFLQNLFEKSLGGKSWGFASFWSKQGLAWPS